GFDSRLVPLGTQALVFDLVDRILDAGLVAGTRHFPGLGPESTLRDEWQIARARGAASRLRRRRRPSLPSLLAATVVRIASPPPGGRARQLVRAIAFASGVRLGRALQS